MSPTVQRSWDEIDPIIREQYDRMLLERIQTQTATYRTITGESPTHTWIYQGSMATENPQRVCWLSTAPIWADEPGALQKIINAWSWFKRVFMPWTRPRVVAMKKTNELILMKLKEEVK